MVHDDDEEDSFRLKLNFNEPKETEIKDKTPSKLKDLKIGILGAGKLAYAIVCGILLKTDIKAKNIYISAKTNRNLTKFRQKGCEVTERNYDIFTRFDCDIVFLCFPSSVIKQCYRIGSKETPFPFTVDYIPLPNHSLNILSLVRGITSNEIVKCLIDPEQLDDFRVGIHRIMLNAGVAYGPKAGIGAIDVDLEECDPIVKELLSSISTLESVPESDMDNLCSFCCSGLGLSYWFSSGLVSASYNLGFDTFNCHKMPAYAMLTAAQSVLESKKSPLELIKEMTSISSCFLPGLQLLRDLKFDLILETAFDAIIKRIEASEDSLE